MSADEKLDGATRKVAFVGGPNAGQLRQIPESAGDVVATDDYLYRIWPFRMPGDKRTLYFAYSSAEHPLGLLFKMWEEYSIAAQIRGGDFGHINRIKPDIDSRS